MFERLGATHDLRNNLNRRRGVDEQNITTIIQHGACTQIPAQKDADVIQIDQNAEQVSPAVQAQLDELKNMFQGMAGQRNIDLELDRACKNSLISRDQSSGIAPQV